MLDDKQRKCTQHVNGPALVLATAGSGKTRVIIERCKYLVDNQYCLRHEILLVTFSNKAANEIKKRLGYDNSEWIGTFHSISFKLLQIHQIISNKTIIIDEYDKKDIFGKLGIMEYLPIISKFETSEKPIYDTKILKAHNSYKQYLKDNNLIDFTQIINVMLETLKKNTEVRNAIQSRFKYIMIDEFQDVNKNQYEMIKLMTNEQSNIMCVGDDDQCIYAWRGACIDNMFNFSRDWKGAKIYHLNHNYRSVQPIVYGAQNICKSIEHKLDKDDTHSDKEGEVIYIQPCRHEGDFIARKIKNINPNETIAILVRSIKQITNIENSLMSHDIPYDVMIGDKILERVEVRALMAYIRTIYYNDITSLSRMLKYPARGIGPKKLEKINEFIENSRNTIIGENVLIAALESVKAFGLAEQIKQWMSIQEPHRIIETIWTESGLSSEYDDKHVRMIIEKSRQFNKIEDFIQSLITMESDENGRVCIMTIHTSKGLEFDNVFIPGVSEGNIPHQNAIMFNKIDDERRVLNVAMTRAKNRLWITYNPMESNGDFFGASRFLMNIPRKYSINFILDD